VESAPVRPVRRDLPSDRGEVGSDLGERRFGRFPKVGDSFDGYSLRSVLGQGNMGKIYRARDAMNRDLAMKVILTDVANEEGLARFEREGQALAAIPRHKNVVQVHSTGLIRGMPYMTMDYVEGETLDALLKEQGPLPLKQAGIVGEKLGKALQHVHNAGVLHRDLKPANVIVRNDTGEPVLADFGLAGLRGAQSLTQTGDLLGTPLYMSPEQILGLNRNVDGRADVWGLGVILYQMITGSLPFPGTSMVEVSHAITTQEPLRLSELNQEVDSVLADIISKALAKDRDQRYPSPGALSEALKRWRRARRDGELAPEVPPSKARFRAAPLLAVAGVAVRGVGLGAFALWSRAHAQRAERERARAAERGQEDQREEDRLGASEDAQARARAAMAEATAALEGGDAGQAAALLDLPEVREALRGAPEARALRDEALAQGLALTRDGARLARVRPLFGLLAVLKPLVPEPADPALFREVVARASAFDAASPTALGDVRAVEWLEDLAWSRVAPDHPAALDFVDRQLPFRAGGVRDRAQDFRSRYYRVLLAMVRLEVDLAVEHFWHLEWGAWRDRPRSVATDPRERYLRCILELIRYQAPESHSAEKQRLVVQELVELMREASPQELGPRNRANALSVVVRPEWQEFTSDPLGTLRDGLKLAPDHLGLLRQLTDLLAVAGLGALENGRAAAAKEHFEEANLHARAALAEVGRLRYETRSSHALFCFHLRKRAVELAAVLGDEARAKSLQAGFQANPAYSAERAMELRQTQAAGRFVGERMAEALEKPSVRGLGD
jgi:hypothetical protein